MPVRICKVQELTPHGRGRKSSMDSLSEFLEVKAKLSYGLKPCEAIEVELPTTSPKSLQGTLKRHIVRYIKKLSLSDYEVQAYRASGKDFVSVTNTAQPTQIRESGSRFPASSTKVA